VDRSTALRNAKGKIVGVIGTVHDITGRKQSEERIRTLTAEILAAREAERKLLSSALHHDVGSLAVGMAAYLDAVEADLRSGKLSEALLLSKRARKLFEESIGRLKGLAVELRPPELDVLGLSAALRQHFSLVTKRAGVLIRLSETLGRKRLPEEHATMLFRIAQEALTNAIKHGNAKRVDVHLDASSREITLAVRDDGKGFDPSARKPRAGTQMGLAVMREMARAAAGALRLDSAPGKGTRLRVSLPRGTAAAARGKATLPQSTAAPGKAGRRARSPRVKKARRP
jgi:signal transduction histidine kinase